MSDESMNSLEDLLDQHDYDMPQPGDIRVGVVVANTPQGLIIDLGLKRDGIVPQSDLAKLEPEERDALKVNDEVPVYIVQTEDPETLVVSIHLARLNQDWIEAEALLASGAIFEGEVIGYNKGGVIVPYGRIRGFVPISHLSDVTPGMGERRRQQRLARLRGEMIGVKIIEVDRHRHRLVMSQREAQKEWEEKKRGELMETLQPGEIRTGRVSGMREFGAFVDLGGADGLVHISELSWHRIDHPREVVKLGDEIEVYVLGVDQESGRISLSRKKLLPNPWDSVAQRYTQNELIEGKITRILDYGAFAEIEPGVEGLLHVSQLSRNPVEDPRAIVKEGEVHLLRIVSIDQKRQRIGLSLKAVTPTEQIEWMAQKELAEALRREEEEAAAAARGPAYHAEEAAESQTSEVEEAVDETEVLDSAAEEASSEIGDEGTTVEEIADVAGDAVNKSVEAISSAAAETEEAAGDAVEEVVETVDSAAEVTEETVGEVAEEAEEAVTDVADTVADTAEQAVDESREVTEEGIDTVGDAVEEAEEATDSLVERVQEAASDAADAVKDAVSAVVERIESAVDGDGDNLDPDEGEAESAA